MTPDDVHRAADLLAMREELLEDMAPFRAAKLVRVSVAQTYTHTITSPGHPRNGEVETRETWRDGPEVKLTAATRKVLLGAFDARLAEIDTELRRLGVTPPAATGDDVSVAPQMPTADAELPL